MLMGLPCDQPTTYHEVGDHNEGVDERVDLQVFLGRQSAEASHFFQRLLEAPPVVALLDELVEVRSRWYAAEEDQERRESLSRMNEMQSTAFARAQVARWGDDPDG